MSYLYVSNLDPFNRSDQLEIQLDNGSAAILRLGHYYDLTAAELARARQYVVLTSSVTPSDEAPIGVVRMPVKGNPATGQVPIWSTADGAFVPGAMTGGSGPTPVVETISVAGGLRGEMVPQSEPAVWGVGSRTITPATRTWLMRFSPKRAWNITLAKWDVTTAATADDSVELAFYNSVLSARLATSGVQSGQLNALGIKGVSLAYAVDPALVYYVAFKAPVALGGTAATLNARTCNSVNAVHLFGTTVPTALAGYIDSLSSPLPNSINAANVTWNVVNTYPMIALREV